MFPYSTKSGQDQYFLPLHQDHLFSHVAWHNERKLLSYFHRSRLFMGQLVSLLSFCRPVPHRTFQMS